MASRSATACVTGEPATAWQRLADFGAIATWAPPVSHSRMLTPGDLDIGSVRRVQLGRQTLLETVTLCEPPRRLGYRLSGLPPRIGAATTVWELSPAGPGSTRITVTSELASSVPRPVAALVLRRLERAAQELLAGFTTTGIQAEAGA